MEGCEALAEGFESAVFVGEFFDVYEEVDAGAVAFSWVDAWGWGTGSGWFTGVAFAGADLPVFLGGFD